MEKGLFSNDTTEKSFSFRERVRGYFFPKYSGSMFSVLKLAFSHIQGVLSLHIFLCYQDTDLISLDVVPNLVGKDT